MSQSPCQPEPSDAQTPGLAFCSLNGHQQGAIFPLPGPKTVLQFASADTNDQSPPTQCLVIEGKDGVSIRTIQGALANTQHSGRDFWVEVGGEIACGDSRLRLIRYSEVIATQPTATNTETTVPDEALGQTTMSQHRSQPLQAQPADRPERETEQEIPAFFARFQPAVAPSPGPADMSSTMLISDEELRAIQNPTVHCEEGPEYLPAASTASEITKSEEPKQTPAADITVPQAVMMPSDPAANAACEIEPLEQAPSHADHFALDPFAIVAETWPSNVGWEAIPNPVSRPLDCRTVDPAMAQPSPPTALFFVNLVHPYADLPTDIVACRDDNGLPCPSTEFLRTSKVCGVVLH